MGKVREGYPLCGGVFDGNWSEKPAWLRGFLLDPMLLVPSTRVDYQIELLAVFAQVHCLVWDYKWYKSLGFPCLGARQLQI